MSNTFTYGKQGHLRRDHMQGVPRNNVFFFFLKIIQREDPSLLQYAEGVSKSGIGLMSTDQQGSGKITVYHWEMC